GGLLHDDGGGRGGRLEPDREEDDLARRIVLREAERVGAAVHHADVGALGLRFKEAFAIASRDPHHVAERAEGDARTARELDRLLEPADGEHADRTPRAVDHLDLRRKHLDDAVTPQRVRVATAELHEAVAAIDARLL